MIVRTCWQRRALAEMHRSLSRSDPRLVARFNLFSRLTADTDIPPFERVRGWAGGAIMLIRRRRRPATSAGVRWRDVGVLLVPVLALMFTILATLGGHSAPCGGSPRAAGGATRQQLTAPWFRPVPGCPAAPAPAHSRAQPGR